MTEQTPISREVNYVYIYREITLDHEMGGDRG
jgi:hypothetical protein